jgi:hypothetical protein
MRPSIFLPAIMCMWATVSTCTGAVQSYHGMVVLRFFLGFVEAPFFRKSSYHFFTILTRNSLPTRSSQDVKSLYPLICTMTTLYSSLGSFSLIQTIKYPSRSSSIPIAYWYSR